MAPRPSSIISKLRRRIGVRPVLRDGVYDPPSPRASPLLEAPRRPPPKPRFGTTPSPLLSNPYAHILAGDVRRDVLFDLRLPTAFLQRFAVRRHPETRKHHFLPIEARQKSSRTSYVPLLHSAIGHIGKRKARWASLIPAAGRESLITKMDWPHDMDDVVLTRLRREAERLLTHTGPRDSRKLEHIEHPYYVPGAVVSFMREPVVDVSRTVRKVKDKTVPVHWLAVMLGKEAMERVREDWKADEDSERVVNMSFRTVGVLVALMRLRACLGLGYVRADEVVPDPLKARNVAMAEDEREDEIDDSSISPSHS